MDGAHQNDQFTAKVHFAQRDHNPPGKPEPYLKAAVLQRHVKEDTRGGRKTFEASYSLCEEFRPGCRLVPHRLTGAGEEDVARGRRYIQVATGGKEEVPKGKLVSNKSQIRSDTTDLPIIGWTRKHNVKQDDGVPAHLRQSSEYDMEGYMNRKQRVTSVVQQRNGIPVAVPGDRPFKDVTHEPGYCAKGGLIPGSSIQMRKSAKPVFKKNESDSPTNKKKGKDKSMSMTYEQRQEMLERDYDRKQVEILTNESLNFQGQEVPSWENRTGFFLIKPEDENY